MRKQVRGSLALLLATVIWGSTFVAQSVGVDQIGPLTFLAMRGVLAIAFLLPLTVVRNRHRFVTVMKNKRLWIGGLCCGTAMFVATALQQIGLVYTTAAKGGFITALYIVLVPIFGAFIGKKTSGSAVVGVAVAAVGLYLISGAGVSGVNRGDVLMMLCAAAFAVQILILDHVAPGLDSLGLNLVQSLVCTAWACIFMWTEQPQVAEIVNCWLPIAYAGILSTGVAYTLQIKGQQLLDPTSASLIMSFESVFALLSGWLILHEGLTATEAVGCGLVLVAILFSQVPLRRKK